MSLQGSLETFALPDVLVLLSSTKKDGELRVVGGRVDGRVWLEKGQIVHTVMGENETEPVDAVFELLRLETGTFSFENERKAPKRSEPRLIDLVLADAQMRLGEWKEITKVVPHLDAVVDMAAEAPGDEVVITKNQWRLLRTVAGGRSVSDLMRALGQSEFDACKTVKELVDSTLASIDVSARPNLTPDVKPEPAPRTEVKAEVKPEVKPEVKAEPPPTPVAPKIEPALGGGDAADELDALAELASRPRKVRSTTSSTSESTDEKPDDKAEPADEAKALVAQLAALDGEDEEAVAQKVAEHLAQGGELPEVPEGDEPINRGLLLKFLSSVRN